MARVVNEEENAARRNQILDVTQRLIYTKGYEKMTIQDVLDGLQMSKGAFYHYFASKEALLEALTDRMLDSAMLALHPIEVDPHLSGLEKLRLYLNTATQWKTERIDLLLPLVRVWYHDDNLVAREKYFTKSMRRISGFMTEVICQGVREGTMTTPYPEQVGEVILAIFLNMGENLAQFILVDERSSAQMERAGRTIEMYSDALERILGVAPGALQLVDPRILRQWFVTPEAELIPAAPVTA
jgi:TetR/AcrR family transcriptional repressor of nem operon